MATHPSDQAPPAPANATPPGPPAQRLKPCPFCGGAAEFERLGTGRVSCIVVCYGCGARHESSDSGAASGASWNRRHTDPAVGSLLAGLDTDHVVEFEDGEIATMQIGVNIEGDIVHRMWDGECWSAEWCEAEIQHRWLAMLGRLVSGEHVNHHPERP